MGVTVALIVSSCANSGSSVSGDSGSNKENEVNSTEGNLSSSKREKASKGDLKISDCLEKFDHDYAKMLTLDDLASHQELDQSTVKTKVSPTKGEYGSVSYTWASDRPEKEMVLNSHKMMVPDNNYVELKNMFFYDDGSAETVELFERGYKKLSEKELAQIEANLEKSFAEKPDELENAKKLMKVREATKHSEVPDLGTRAYWKWDERFGGDLITLVGKAKFTVVAKVSKDPDTSLAFAKKLAQEVIDKCN